MSSVDIPDRLKTIIERQVALGRATSIADYVEDALIAYADRIDAEADIAALVARADADLAAGRVAVVAGPADSDALHARTMDRLRARMIDDRSLDTRTS